SVSSKIHGVNCSNSVLNSAIGRQRRRRGPRDTSRRATFPPMTQLTSFFRRALPGLPAPHRPPGAPHPLPEDSAAAAAVAAVVVAAVAAAASPPRLCAPPRPP